MTILWAINDRNGAALPLVNKEVHLYYTCERGRFEADIEIQDENVVIWHFLGKDQRVLGSYTLTLEILQSEGKRTIKKDVCNAFILVGKDCEEDYDDDEAHINNGGEITLASDLDIYRISPIIPYVGDDGYWYIDGVKTEWYAYGTGEPGRTLVVYSMEELEALNVRKGSLASVVSQVNEVQKPLSELYDYIADGGNPMGNDVPYSALDTITDFVFTFPNLSAWPYGVVVIGSKSGGPDAVFHIQVDAQYVRLFYVVEGKANVIILAEKNGTSHTVFDDAVAEAHAYLRAIPDLCYYGVNNGSVSDMEQFFKAIVAEETADAYILGETWQRLMKDGEMPEIDLSALAQKADLDALAEAVVENEEVTAAELNDLNERVKAIPTAIDAELSETSANPVQNKAITTKLNEKQDALVSGSSIKTINGQSLLGEGNLEVVTDLSAMATKAELQDLSDVVTSTKTELQGSLDTLTAEMLTNEEVTAAALNDLNDRKASKEDVANAIAEAITNTLNTAV